MDSLLHRIKWPWIVFYLFEILEDGKINYTTFLFHQKFISYIKKKIDSRKMGNIGHKKVKQ